MKSKEKCHKCIKLHTIITMQEGRIGDLEYDLANTRGALKNLVDAINNILED